MTKSEIYFILSASPFTFIAFLRTISIEKYAGKRVGPALRLEKKYEDSEIVA